MIEDTSCLGISYQDLRKFGLSRGLSQQEAEEFAKLGMIRCPATPYDAKRFYELWSRTQ